METNNLTYTLQINYINDSGLPVVIYKHIADNGLEVISFRVGDDCVTEETINGRVLSGKYEHKVSSCGYKYNYEKTDSEYLVGLNANIPVNTAVNLINKTKMNIEFLSAKMVLSSITRNDYRVLTLKKGDLQITKTATAQTETAEPYSFQEQILLSKLEGEESFTEKETNRFYKMGDTVVEDNNSKIKFEKLITVVKQNPTSYKDLVLPKTTASTIKL